MFGLGILEILLILVLALLVLGPSKLPEAARELGKMTAQLRRAMDDLKHDVSVGEFSSTQSMFDSTKLTGHSQFDCCESESPSPKKLEDTSNSSNPEQVIETKVASEENETDQELPKVKFEPVRSKEDLEREKQELVGNREGSETDNSQNNKKDA